MKIKKNRALGLVDVVERLLHLVFVVIFTSMALCAGYMLYDNMAVSYGEEIKIKKLKSDLEVGEDKYEGMVGWIKINGTNIDYPLMQGADNKKYLNHDFKGDYALAGSIFLDYRNAISDDYLVIYGHRMSGGIMFSDIGRFEEEGFLQEHESASLELGGETMEVRLLGFLKVMENDEILYSVGGYENSAIADYFERQMGRDLSYRGGRLVLLSTCDAWRYRVRNVVLGEF